MIVMITATYALKTKSKITGTVRWIIGTLTGEGGKAKWDVSLAHRKIIDKRLLEVHEEPNK